MKNNPLLKYLVIPFVILALIVMAKLFSGGSPQPENQESETLTLTTDQAKQLGVDGDTPADTLRTIVTESRQLKDQVSNALKGNDEQKQHNQELQKRLQNFDQSVDSKLQSAHDTLKRPKKTVPRNAIEWARDWLIELVTEERTTKKRSKITPAWFWLAAFELFYHSGIRLNALLNLRYQDVHWDSRLIRVEADKEKTHREYSIPITADLEPHIRALWTAAKNIGFEAEDQLFNVNRFSHHYRRKTMNTDQVEAMYRKLHKRLETRMTPHRFRHTLATDLMRQPERNIHLTKSLLNHSNISTTLGYIEVDYGHMRAVMQERSLAQGTMRLERRVDDRIPVSPPAEVQPAAEAHESVIVPLLITHALEQPVEHVNDQPPPPNTPEKGLATYKLLTQVPSLESERYSLDQAMQQVGTGLSHELTWDGPGTWWDDLGIPPPTMEESAESSMMLTLMFGLGGLKSHSWG